MRDQLVGERVARAFAREGLHQHAPDQSLDRQPADDAVGARLGQADPDRLRLPLAQVTGLDDRQQPRLEAARHMRRLIDERHARPLELAHELRILRHRRQQHDVQRRIGIEDAIEQPARAQHVAGAGAVRNGNENCAAHVNLCLICV
jgi:hypothetical protein